MKFKFNCPHCGQRISAADEDVGDTAFCPGCSAELIVPPRESVSETHEEAAETDAASEATPHSASIDDALPLSNHRETEAPPAETPASSEIEEAPEASGMDESREAHEAAEPAESAGEPAEPEAPRAFRTRMHPVVFVSTALGTLFWTGILFAAAGHPAVIDAFGPKVCGIARIGAPICFILGILPSLLRFLGSGIELTDERLVIKNGLLSSEPFEIAISKIKSVTVKQDGFGRLLNFGTVTLHRAGGTETFETIAKPIDLRSRIDAIQMAAAASKDAVLAA